MLFSAQALSTAGWRAQVASSGGYGLFSSNGGWNAIGFAVRPVVVLKSDIKESQLEVLEGVEEPDWGDYEYGTADRYSGNIADNP